MVNYLTSLSIKIIECIDNWWIAQRCLEVYLKLCCWWYCGKDNDDQFIWNTRIKKRKFSSFHYQLQPLIVAAFVRTKLYTLFCYFKHHIFILSCYSSSRIMKVSSHLKNFKILNWKMLMMKSRTKMENFGKRCWDVCCKGASKEAFCRILYHL